jgi:hypothetical protein
MLYGMEYALAEIDVKWRAGRGRSFDFWFHGSDLYFYHVLFLTKKIHGKLYGLLSDFLLAG